MSSSLPPALSLKVLSKPDTRLISPVLSSPLHLIAQLLSLTSTVLKYLTDLRNNLLLPSRILSLLICISVVKLISICSVEPNRRSSSRCHYVSKVCSHGYLPRLLHHQRIWIQREPDQARHTGKYYVTIDRRCKYANGWNANNCDTYMWPEQRTLKIRICSHLTYLHVKQFVNYVCAFYPSVNLRIRLYMCKMWTLHHDAPIDAQYSTA